MLWRPGRRKPRPKDFLTLTTWCEFPQIPTPPPPPRPGNWFWNINMWGYSMSETAALKLAFSWLASQTDPLPPPSQPDPILLSLPHHIPPMPHAEWLLSQSMFQLMGRLASHMLSICSVFPDYQDVPDQIALRWNAFGRVDPACLSRNIRAAA